MKMNRRIIKNLDWITLVIISLISLIGIMTIYSATRSPVSSDMPSFYLKQIYWLFLSLATLSLVVSFDYIWFARFSNITYGFGLFLLILVLFLGRTGMGAQRWLNLGFVSFQPSEVFKIIYIIAISKYLSEINIGIGATSLIKIFLLLVLVPVTAIMKQPDLGTATVLLLAFLLLTLIKGLQKKVVILIVLISIISIPFFSNILWEGLKDYQKNRIVAFLDPEIDPAGIGYHISQSKVAVGSGQFAGKGYLKGTQGPLQFLPEKHTDFIFSVFAEEWGFAGSMLLLLLYLTFILQGFDTARKAKDEFGRLLAAGISCMFAVYFFVNIGMTLGIMPVVGIPLPFMSYGGTALLTNFILAGILINIRTRRFELFY